MKEKFHLPEYIAARFNLHIRHVHKGILLGTGPLIDPGFSGKLLIPLHNLTDNDYKSKGGEGIIWVEFTKLSIHEFWNQPENRDNPPYLPSFPDDKDFDDPSSYFSRSGIYDESGVQSAFKGALDEAKKNADDAKNSADDSRKGIEQVHKKYQNIGLAALIIGGLAIAFTIIGTIWTGYSLISDAVSRVQDSRNQELFLQIQRQDDKLKEFEAVLDEVKTHLATMPNSQNESKQQIEESNDIEDPQPDSVQDQ